MPLNTPIRNWRGKRVWIIGASVGIGAALAEALAAQGACLALSARRRDRLEECARALPGSLVIPLDVCQPDALLPAVMQILDIWGGIDVVIFNAGTYVPVRAWDLEVEGARLTLETNFMSVLNGIAAVLPQMLQQAAGALVVVGSTAGYRGLPDALVYGASKAALIHFCESLYLDLAPRGVGVFLVSPGFAATQPSGQSTHRLGGAVTPAQAAAAILRGMARGRFEIHFPRRVTLLLKGLRLLPTGVYLRLLQRVLRQAR